MRVGVISDVHGNLAALESVLAAIDAVAPDEIWCLGDIVGYGARPNECCALVRARATTCLAGNHDLAVRGTIDLRDFSGDAGIAAGWTRAVLAPEWLDWLNELDTQGSAHDVALYHGSARDPVWEYVLSDEAALATLALTTAPLVLVGHSHVALAVSSSSTGGLAPGGWTLDVGAARWLLNPGSVGQPRDGDPRAAWLSLDLDAGTATFERVEYDVARTEREILDAGLPEPLARRLASGV